MGSYWIFRASLFGNSSQDGDLRGICRDLMADFATTEQLVESIN
jgi:hypothetical protein